MLNLIKKTSILGLALVTSFVAFGSVEANAQTTSTGTITLQNGNVREVSNLTNFNLYTDGTSTNPAVDTVYVDVFNTNPGDAQATFRNTNNSTAWTASATLTNFTDGTNIMTMCDYATSPTCDTGANAQRYSLTADPIQVVSGVGGTTGISSELTGTPSVVSTMTDTSATGTSNATTLFSFSAGNGVGEYTKKLNPNWTIPPYQIAGTYTSTLTVSIS
jgi:acyl-coenzyme A thioesterase PaaI-like protein